MSAGDRREPAASRRLSEVACWYLAPALVYLVGFAALTWPLVLRFSTHFYCDDIDGYQNVWNLWWVNEALTRRGTHPWHTDLLHHPYGISLLGHTLNPFNGLLAIPLLRVMSLLQAHNTITLFSFVAAGLTAFHLCRRYCGSWWASLLGGALYTFSPYHFSHVGHLQLVALQWVPLFLLFWTDLLERPRVATGLWAGAALTLVILCDYYQCFCCMLAAALTLVWAGWRRRRELWRDLLGAPLPALVRGSFFRSESWGLRKPYVAPLAALVAVAAPVVGTLCLLLLVTSGRDPYAQGGHPPRQFSLDLLALVLPDRQWRFGELTRWYWSDLGFIYPETSARPGLAALLLAGVGLVLAAPVLRRRLAVWTFLAVAFWALALGPALHVRGRPVPFFLPMPYDLLERVFPPLGLGGVPQRFLLITVIGVAVLAAAGAVHVWRRSAVGRAGVLVLVGLLAVDLLPAPLPSARPQIPGVVRFLATHPEPGALLEMASDDKPGEAFPLGVALHWQTVHRRPMVFGYVARTPRSTKRLDNALRRDLTMGRYDALWRTWRVRFLLCRKGELPRIGESGAKLFRAAEGYEVWDLSRAVRPARPEEEGRR